MIILWSVYVHELCPPQPKILEVKRAPQLAEVSNTIIIWHVKEKIYRGKQNS